MAQFSFHINNKRVHVEADPDTPILWVIREKLQLMGTKYSCGMALCGSCTIHIDGNPIKSCVTPVAAVEGRKITTIEGLSNQEKHPLQEAWIEAQAPQCGYCQPGQIMQAVSLLERNNQPTREEITAHMSGNLCRCGAYMRIIKAIENAAEKRSV